MLPAMHILRSIAMALIAAIALAACAVPGVPAREVRIELGGANQVPPNKSTASGRATIWVHADRTVDGIIETSGMSGTAASISVGGPAAIGPVAVQLIRNSSEGPVAMEQAPVSGSSWSVPRSARLGEEQYRAFLAGETYINVHSARFPEGEIRGQLKP